MHINDVCNMLGLSKKSIRYYEDIGLIKPSRNRDNDYREYNEDDINKLKLIKFLRELDVPICELQDMNCGKLTLRECMERRLDKIKSEEEKFDKIKSMCMKVIDDQEDFNSIDISNYFQSIRILNKEGFTMKNKNNSHFKKIFGAVFSSLVFLTIFGFLIGFFTYTYFVLKDIILIAYLLFVFIFLLLFISILYNLIVRIKEILGGEEDEISKY